jgi:hypothetical protein
MDPEAQELVEFITYTGPGVMILGGIILWLLCGLAFSPSGHTTLILVSGILIIIGVGAYGLKLLHYLVHQYTIEESPSSFLSIIRSEDTKVSPPSRTTDLHEPQAVPLLEIPELTRLSGREALKNLHECMRELESQRGHGELTGEQTDALIRVVRELMLAIGERTRDLDEHTVRLSRAVRSGCASAEAVQGYAVEHIRRSSSRGT